TWPLTPFIDSLGGRDYGTGGSWGVDPVWYAPPAVEDFEAEPFLSNWTDLVETISMCEVRRIHVLLVNFPQSPLYANSPYMGKYGPTWANWQELSRRLDSLQTRHPYLHFYDAHRGARHEFPQAAFGNEDHLNHTGAILLTGKLDSIIRTFELREIPK
ncbi:MAG: hypothetical protein AAB214_08005, partial [Fibrobacterota bacterium]